MMPENWRMRPQSDLKLFVRAICDDDGGAWEQLDKEYGTHAEYVDHSKKMVSNLTYTRRLVRARLYKLHKDYLIQKIPDLVDDLAAEAWDYRFVKSYTCEMVRKAKGIQAVTGYLATCVVSAVQEVIKKQKPDLPLPAGDYDDDDWLEKLLYELGLKDDKDNPTTHAELHELIRRVWECMVVNCLDKIDEKIMRLTFIDDRRPRQIAVELGIPVEEVYKRTTAFWKRVPSNPCFKKLKRDFGGHDV